MAELMCLASLSLMPVVKGLLGCLMKCAAYSVAHALEVASQLSSGCISSHGTVAERAVSEEPLSVGRGWS